MNQFLRNRIISFNQKTLLSNLNTLFKLSVGICLIGVSLSLSASMGDEHPQKSKLALVLEIFPNADAALPSQTDKPFEIVLADDAVIGFILYTDEVFPIPAYSGKPIRALVAISADGIIKKVNIISHSEPILVVGLSSFELQQFTNQYVGVHLSEKVKLGRQQRKDYKNIDGISGATITTMVLHQSIIKSARYVMSNSPRLAADETKVYTETIADKQPLWVQQWQTHRWQIGILLMALVCLTGLLFLQDWVVVHPRNFHIFRVSFLVFTFVFIGLYLRAQLSIINIITFVQVLTSGFSWDTLMIDPYIFALWAFVAFSILLWGRGVYCGWLCPFGALQELINKTAVYFKVKQLHIPTILHERLWAIKYIVLMALVGLSLDSMVTVIPFVDIEPFKTTFSLRFQREWYYILYVITLLAITVVNAKFYCKYICPLGAALSIGTRFRIFDWLRRRKECGTSCQACANDCSVGAIKQTGEIIENECHYCLECQATYWDEHKCPAMVSKRERRERREKRQTLIPTRTLK